MRILLYVAALFTACAGVNGALALPAPMSASDLLSKSDLVGLIRVLSVTCVSISKDERPARNSRAIKPGPS